MFLEKIIGAGSKVRALSLAGNLKQTSPGPGESLKLCIASIKVTINFSEQFLQNIRKESPTMNWKKTNFNQELPRDLIFLTKNWSTTLQLNRIFFRDYLQGSKPSQSKNM
jgi:hypothetical protein